MTDFVTLSCPSCGGKLEITQDIERFACAHCGREHIVKRSGGVVSLSPIVDAVKEVKVSVDKTNAELAIVRLEKEIGELHANRTALLKASPRPAPNVIFALLFVLGICVALYSLISILGAVNGQSTSSNGTSLLIGVAMLAIGGVVLFIWRPGAKHWEETTGVQLKSLDGQLTSKDADLRRNKDVVSQ
jgi:hypothetical protein